MTRQLGDQARLLRHGHGLGGTSARHGCARGTLAAARWTLWSDRDSAAARLGND